MCKIHKFWDLKSKFRKSLSFKNRNILVIEKLQEEFDINESKAIELLIEASPLTQDTLLKLRKDYTDI